MKWSETVYVLAATLLAAGIVAATNPNAFGDLRIFLYAYWLVRLSIECGLFIAFRSLLEAAGMARERRFLLFSSAFLLSLIPFVLAITALDIVLGFPELGLAVPGGAEGAFLREFFLEVGYLADDHLFLCLLVSLPRLIARSGSPTLLLREFEQPLDEAHVLGPEQLPMLDAPLKGALLRVEAQEHYVIINTTEEQRMVLGRFSDIVALLPGALGMQVHRSHWVAGAAVSSVFTEKRNMKLRLRNGDVVPVSRRFRSAVQGRFDLGGVSAGGGATQQA
ncbi:LytTR family DNA-binding domain-containing protein [Nitratireductor sp. XY-223]|uniref:LytTR family DNA-binding domain-containing protein n=1 Tax=Nitratireductor sp. XY-223 TaxID=2561926 RepID=UPI00145A8259|nr:LytTR family DNA-binding domain-containing protein [Nitratireductor sp. XY-223]